MMAVLRSHGVMIVALFLLWLLMAGISVGQALLGVIVALVATSVFSALGEASPRIRRWDAAVRLLGIVLADIVRSNAAVAWIILKGGGGSRRSGFVTIKVRLKDPSALALLSIIVTSTPGTAWLDYNAARCEVLLHVLDLVDERHWQDLIAERYERLLLEIFA